MRFQTERDDEEIDDTEIEPPRFLPLEGDGAWAPVPTWGDREWTHWLSQHDGWDPSRISQYLHVDRYKYGVGFQRHRKDPFQFFYLPVPAAVPFHASKSTNVCYGGSVGGTKSYSSRWDAYRHLLSIENYNSLIMRRTHTELEQNHTLRAVGECERINEFFQRKIMDLTPSQHRLEVTTTHALLNFGHCQNLGDEEKYLGPEYDDFRPEELATFIQQQVIGVQGRLRSAKFLATPEGQARVKARLIGTTNPGGAQAQWIKRYFIDKNVSAQENPRYEPSDWQFLQASLYDNPYFMDPDGTYSEYEKRLFMFSRQRRRQLLEGDWNAVTGQFFEEWDAQIHVRVLPVTNGVKIERWLDWGYDPNPGYCCWVACFPNGRLYVFAEMVFNGTGRPKLVAGKVAQRIARLTKDEILGRNGYGKSTISKTVMDPSMFAKDGHTGESYAETFRRNGVWGLPGDNDRAMGWGRKRHWLGRHPEGGAWLMFHPDCTYAIRTIPALVHDEGNPDDVDTTGEDHAADAIRYGLMARPTPTKYIYTPAPSLPESIAHLVAAERVRYAVRQPGQVM